MPISCLAIAGLVAFALDAVSARLSKRGGEAESSHRLAGLSGAAFVAAAVMLLALDLRVPVFGAVAADTPTAAYAAIHGEGRMLELPVFRPDIHYGSVYLGYARQSPRGRPEGYSTTAPLAADRLARRLRDLSCGRGPVPKELGIRYVGVHRGLYAQSGFFGEGCAGRAEAALRRAGWRLLARDGVVSSWQSP
jgi:hypothetical protein